VAVVLTIVQTKQIKIDIHKRNNKKHSTNNTKHRNYKYTFYRNIHTIVKTHPHVTKEVNTTTVQDTHQIKYSQYIQVSSIQSSTQMMTENCAKIVILDCLLFYKSIISALQPIVRRCCPHQPSIKSKPINVYIGQFAT
jgi:hypothetical protein